MKHTIYQGDSMERIKEIPKDSFQLVITSPPYFTAKEYNKEDNNIGNIKEYENYLMNIKILLEQIYEKIVPGGIVCWNTSPILKESKRIGIPFDTHNLFTNIGFELLEDVVWVKPLGSAKLRCGGWYQGGGKPFTWHANIATEYIFIYKKTGERKIGDWKHISYYYKNIPKDLTSNVWHINPETNTKWHDAPFPEELVKRCIILYSFIGDTILDPFAGSFTTTKTCRKLERNSIGIELSKTYIEQAKNKMNFYQQGLFCDNVFEEK